MRELNSQNKLLSIKSSSSIDSSSWVIHIRSFFEEREGEKEEPENDNTQVCIYNVPKTLRALKPEAYSPQLIALGPYHHWRQDLYEMERFKLLCAKKVQKEFKNLKFEDLVKKLLKKEHEIRGCYHKYLDMDGEALAWMMAIDGLFLLEFLHLYVNKSSSLVSEARISFLANSMGKKLSFISILNDILMLENQMPIFVLKKILRVQCSSSDLVENLLPPMLISVCNELSPLRLNQNYPVSEAMNCAHLLDLLYHLMVPKLELNEDQEENSKNLFEEDEEDPSNFVENKEVFTKSWEIVSKLKAMKKFKNVLNLKPLKLVAKLPLKVISKLPIVSTIAPMLENMLLGNSKDGSNNQIGSTKKDDQQLLLVEEIMIPSVANLYDSGVEFCPTDGDITTVRFDKRSKIFYLPVINIDGNTEVMMRNLVAFEASSHSSHLVLARFCELMNGIIDTSKDVEILRKKKILTSRLRKDEEVAELWNGMTKAIRLSKVEFIDEAIKEVNGYYNNTLKRKLHKVMKRYVYNSWRILVVLATLLLLGLMVLQSFCSVYSCPRFFNIEDNNGTTTTHP